MENVCNIEDYCKRWYFRVINFSRFAAQKHIRGLLNSRWADAHLSFLYCTIQHHSMNDTFTSIHVTGQHKNKQISDRLEYILPICINTHGQYTTPTCPKCAYKISQIFSRVFEFALAEKPRNPRKLMYREYFRVYSIWNCLSSKNYWHTKPFFQHSTH